MSVALGINPITWTNDDMPELGGDIPLEVCLSEARAAGFAGIEMGGKFPREATVLRPLLARHRLDLVSGWYSARLAHRSVAEELTAISAHLDLPGTIVQTEAEIDRLMAGTDPDVGLLLDTGHLAFAGGDPVAVARRHGSRIVHVHCKDVRPAVLADALRGDHSFLRAVLDGLFTVPGDGSIDYVAVLTELHRTGYAGWLVVEAEQDPAKAHPLTYARLGFTNLKRAAEAAGFAVELR